MDEIMIGNVSIINPKLVTGPNSTSIIETKARMPTAMEKMLVTAVEALEGLNHHLKIKDEKKNQDLRKRNKAQKHIVTLLTHVNEGKEIDLFA